MPKTILQELEDLLGKEAAAKVSSNPEALARLSEMDRVYSYYTGENGDEVEAAAREAADKQRMTEKAEADRRAAAAAASNNTTNPALADVLKEVTTLNTTLTQKFEDLKKSVVTTDKLPEMRGTVLSDAIRTSHELMRLDSNHTKEFGEDLDLAQLEKFADEQQKAGAKFPSITAAYNTWIGEKRIEARVKKEVEEQVKAKTSGANVPAQTSTASLSPAQQVLREARSTTSTGTKTHAQVAAERLANLERSRQEAA